MFGPKKVSAVETKKMFKIAEAAIDVLHSLDALNIADSYDEQFGIDVRQELMLVMRFFERNMYVRRLTENEYYHGKVIIGDMLITITEINRIIDEMAEEAA